MIKCRKKSTDERAPEPSELRALLLVNENEGCEESPGSLNSKFAWETQVPARVRTVPQKRRQLCEASFTAMSSKNSEDLRNAT